jgi:hypothetical protein
VFAALASPAYIWYVKFIMSISRTRKSTPDTKKKRGRGRPPTGALSIHLRVPPAEIAGIDTWVAQQDDQPSRPEAIRRLAQLGLAASAAPKPKRASRKQEQ